MINVESKLCSSNYFYRTAYVRSACVITQPFLMHSKSCFLWQKDKAAVERLLQRGEKELLAKTHPDPYIGVRQNSATFCMVSVAEHTPLPSGCMLPKKALLHE